MATTKKKQKMEKVALIITKANLASQVTGRTGIVPKPVVPSTPVAIDTGEPPVPSAPAFTVKEADLEDLPEAFHTMFIEMCNGRDVHKQTEKLGKDNEVFRKQVDELIRELFTTIGYNRVVLPDGRVAEECRGTTESTISAIRLLTLGVDADTIASATVPGKPYYFVKVRPLSDKEKEARELRMKAKAKGGV